VNGPAEYGDDFSPRRRAFDRAVQGAVLGTLLRGARHWLLAINVIAGVVAALPILGVPLLRVAGHDAAADAIFAVYGFTCHQMPSRSFTLFGEQMGLCARMSAIHLAFFGFGLAFIPLRRRLRSLPTWLAVAYSAPMAADGFTQLFGWRESSADLRVLTGTFFALAVVWYVFPHFELVMRIFARQLEGELAYLKAAAGVRR
jgi:uncharacterized membrane protein